MSKQTLLILGASGDLTARLLLPGLGGLVASGGAEGISLVGSDVKDWDDEHWRGRVAQSFAAAGAQGEAVASVAASTHYVQADVTAEADWPRVLDACEGLLAIYFALPPAITERACRALTRVKLPTGTRLLMEKPFGTDAVSAEALNRLVTGIVPEDQVYRVDHFLGMSTVVNIAGLRFANRMFEPLLSSDHVESVDILFDETLGLEGRAGFYDHAGALVDMFQSHMLNVLSLVAMEPPSRIDARDIRDNRAAALRATRVWNDDPAANSYRARYTAGQIGDRKLPSYIDEDGIPPESTTETLAEVVFAVDTWRWAGVPFRLRSGKAIGNPRTEVVITFKKPPHVPAGLIGAETPDRLHIGIALDAGRVSLDMNVNGPGDPSVVDPVTLGTDLGAGELPEYGEVLKRVFEANPILSVRGDMAVDCWRIIEPVLRAWKNDEVPLQEYPAGSLGPDGWPLTGSAPTPAHVSNAKPIAA